MINMNFLQQPERIGNANGSESKRAKKKERRLARKKFGMGNRKNPNFSLVHAPN